MGQTAHGRESINTKIRLNRESPRTEVANFPQHGGEYEEQHLPAEHGRGELQTESEPQRSIWRVFAVQSTHLLKRPLAVHPLLPGRQGRLQRRQSHCPCQAFNSAWLYQVFWPDVCHDSPV